MSLKEKCISFYHLNFPQQQSEPLIISSAPGRVNLIGEHTDYNDGFVMPLAIDKETYLVGRKNNRNDWRIVSANEESASTSSERHVIVVFDTLQDMLQIPEHSVWHSYFRGVIAQYVNAGYSIPPFDAAIVGNVPLGGGLSSSASLEVATATFLDGLLGIQTSPVQKALWCQKAEHEYAHVPCGIMDQFVSSGGEENAAMLLDCRSQTFRSVAMKDENVAVLIFNSNVKHALGSGEYAKRRAECEEAVRILQQPFPQIQALRDATIEQLEQVKNKMNEVSYRRGRHVIGECQRTVQAADALDRSDYTLAGRLMKESHYSLKDDYEVSCEELDCLVELALAQPGVFGTRMTGGGFGGCTVTLADRNKVEQIVAAVTQGYKEKTGKEATPMITRPCSGARLHSN